jgi:dipeptidyl aminopeptidase/acylaminoacyl peptidase
MRSGTVDDDRLVARLRRIAEPVEPSADFLARLYDELAGELGFDGAAALESVPWLGRRSRLRWQRMRVPLWLAAALLLALALIAGLALVGALLERRTTQERPQVRNGPILVASEGRSWWIDPMTGGVITAGVPQVPNGVQDAAWSRDGRRLAIVLDGDLELMDAATGVRTVVATCNDIVWQCPGDGERRGSIDWSPDGRSIGIAPPWGLLRLDVASGALTRILGPLTIGSIVNLSWSPDGGWIAVEYVADRPEGGDVSLKRWIEVLRPDGSERHRVSPPTPPESYGAGQPLWSPDGTQLVYLTSDPWIETGDEATRGWPLKVAVLELAEGQASGAAPKRIDLQTGACIALCPSFTLAPDGMSVLFASDALVRVPLDGSPWVPVAPGARVLAWRPVP